MKIQDIFEGAAFHERTTNYKQLAKNIAEEYGYTHSPLSNRLAHGVQKDAIQNGWDAKQQSTHTFIQDNWRFEFELADIKAGKALLMTDFGTTGLTGNLTSEQLRSMGIAADELPKDEKWARWESLGWTKGEGLGARGQGKMIFMLTSKDYTIFYDSLRSDGSYRLGGSIATETGCPVFHCDDEEGKRIIQSNLGLQPLSHQGTRVIIVDPVDEIVEDIYSGDFMKFIEETWWPNIHKYRVKISLKYGGNETNAKVPTILPISKDTPENKSFKTWVRGSDDFKKGHAGFKIKRLCAACDMEQEVDELYQGIACFRDGMKVDIVRFPDKALRNKVFGYIEFEQELEDELREIEKPTHYAFKVRPLWAKLKNLIEQEVEAFGNKKLGLGLDTQALENIKRNKAESKALSILRAVTKDWPISRWSKGGGGSSNVPVPPSDEKDVGVRLSNLSFPNPGNVPRLDYGQKLEGFDIVVFSKEETARDVTLNAFVLSGDTRILDIRKESFQLGPKSHQVFSDHRIDIDNDVFASPGEYKIRVNLIDNTTNDRIDQITRRIWVETEPKLTGPFDVKRHKFADLRIDTRREWILHAEGDDRYTLFYNIDHPAYFHNHETDAKLTACLAEIFCWGALELFVRQGLARKDDLKETKELPLNLDIIAGGEPLNTFHEYTLALSKLREEVYGLV